MDHITHSISDTGHQGRVRIRAFNINTDGERTSYERIMNDSEIVVIEEYPPVMDKTGRIVIVVKWVEPV